MRRAYSLEKTLLLGNIGRQKEEKAAEDEMLDIIADSVDVNFNKLWEAAEDREAWWPQFTESQTVRHDLLTEQQQQ